MTIEKKVSGAYLVSDIVGNQYYKQLYFGYTKRQAIKLFKEYLKTLGA